MKASLVAVALIVVVLPVSADTYTVTKTGDTGPGSLRRAIADANSHIGPDRIVFAPALSGSTISPTSPLPALTGAGTTIDGDTNADGKPNIGIFQMATSGVVLGISGSNCTLNGLAVSALGQALPIVIQGASGCKVTGCHVGADLTGSTVLGTGGLLLLGADHCTIGGTTAARRNVLAPSAASYFPAAIIIMDGAQNTVVGNHIGLTRSGGQTLGPTGYGAFLMSEGGLCTQNRIGGTETGERNRFGGLAYGVAAMGAIVTDNTILGNTFGLLANGKDAAPITQAGVALIGPTLPGSITLNTIGGTVPAARNVFANSPVGVLIQGVGAQDNRVQGNWFGTNVAGDGIRPLTKGVELSEDAGRQTIGGSKAGCGNYFTPNAERGVYTYGVAASAGDGSTIRYNCFGRLPHGGDTGGTCGVALMGVSAQVTDNSFDGGRIGVNVAAAGANPGIYRNRFDGCRTGVDIVGDAQCCLGDLSNSSTRDDGGNVFRLPLLLHKCYAIRNDTSVGIKAEGNDFGTTLKSSIEARIWDKHDDPALGRLDYDPIQGGVHPTGGAVQVTAATTAPCGPGEEIAFVLSSPADVTVSILNVAGRVVAAPARDLPCAPGTQRLLWDGRSAAGLAAPSGRYLVRIEAHGADGTRAVTVASLYRR